MNFTALRQQVEQDLAQPRDVAADRRRHVALEHVGDVEALLGRARADQVERRLDALAQVERLRLDVHAPGLDLREVEDVVDDRQQRVARVADRRGVVALLGVERGVEQQAAHADHRVHRRADLVAHRREERALRLVRGLGRGARLLRLVEQARVLDRDHRLVGEGLEQRDLLVGERLGRLAQQRRSSRCRGPPTASARTTTEKLPMTLGDRAHRRRQDRLGAAASGMCTASALAHGTRRWIVCVERPAERCARTPRAPSRDSAPSVQQAVVADQEDAELRRWRTGAGSCRGSCRTPAAASATELLMTCSTSAVAVCCSSASLVSLNSRAFWIAITAWSAKVCSSRLLLRVEQPRCLPPHHDIEPMPRPSHSIGATAIE